MLRREFLAATAAGFIFPDGDGPPKRSQTLEPESVSPNIWADLGFEPVKRPHGILYRLPKCEVRRIAWTVDDGVSSIALRQYLDFIEKHDLRMTFFITSAYRSWKKNRKQLQELVDQSRVQLANHTFSHVSLTRVSNATIQSELRKCGRFIEDTFGVAAKPYYRPPYGRIDSRVRQAAREIGYRAPVLWNGSLGDSVSQRRKYILRMGNKWIQNRTILIDHVNDPTEPFVFRELAKTLRRRELQTVTLDDVFQS